MQSPETKLKGINYKVERLRLHTWPYAHACMLSCFIYVQLFATPWTVATRLLCPWDSPGEDTAVDCYFVLQGIFLSPALAGGFFTTNATWEALDFPYIAFICLQASSFYINLLSFYQERVLNLVKCFPASVEIIVVFVFFLNPSISITH